MAYIDNAEMLNEPLESLTLEVSTVSAENAESFAQLFVNVVFTDGTRLYEPFNRLLPPAGLFPQITLPLPGDSRMFPLPIPPLLTRTLGEIAEVFIRISTEDGWLVGSVLLFANGHADPLIGNRHANQFLDRNDHVLRLREWSTTSFCVAPSPGAQHPLPSSGYRLLGPVLGQVSANSAVVLYRVDREGRYRFRAFDAESMASPPVLDEIAELEPTGRFTLKTLTPDRAYAFDLTHLRAGVESPVPCAAGLVRTYPAEGTPGIFCLAFGSCANSGKQVAQGCWIGIRSLAQAPPQDSEPVKLFVHLGDTFYFYDKMTQETVANADSMFAAHVSQRRHLEFLDMARVVPTCAVWDDHDFALNNSDSTDLTPSLKLAAREAWLQYWGNDQPARLRDFGLTTLISHGLVDLYLLDGRFNREKVNGICFGQAQKTEIIQMIRERGADCPRLVILATGSNWNHMVTDEHNESYGNGIYAPERDAFYSDLAGLMGMRINGLLLLSGDTHRNEIYSVVLGNGRRAPEFVSSPLTNNTALLDSSLPVGDERLASFATGGPDGRRGFATLTLDTRPVTARWTATVRYYQEAGATEYESRSFHVENGEFVLDS
jgi:hypothetical protein